MSSGQLYYPIILSSAYYPKGWVGKQQFYCSEQLSNNKSKRL